MKIFPVATINCIRNKRNFSIKQQQKEFMYYQFQFRFSSLPIPQNIQPGAFFLILILKNWLRKTIKKEL